MEEPSLFGAAERGRSSIRFSSKAEDVFARGGAADRRRAVRASRCSYQPQYTGIPDRTARTCRSSAGSLCRPQGARAGHQVAASAGKPDQAETLPSGCSSGSSNSLRHAMLTAQPLRPRLLRQQQQQAQQQQPEGQRGFGINSLINRMTGSNDAPAAKQQPQAVRQQPAMHAKAPAFAQAAAGPASGGTGPGAHGNSGVSCADRPTDASSVFPTLKRRPFGRLFIFYFQKPMTS